MSLTKIGNLTKAVNTGEGISEALNAFGNSTAAAKALSKYTGLGSSTKYDLLSSVFGEVPEEAMNIINQVGQGSFALSALSKLAGGVGAVGSGLLSVLSSVWPALLTIGGIAAGVGGFHLLNDKFTLTKGMADKHYEESTQKYSDNQSELESLQSQRDTNKERIYELRAKENQSPDEQT